MVHVRPALTHADGGGLVDQRHPEATPAPRTNAVVMAALRRITQQYGALSADVVDLATARPDESGHRVLIGLADRPGLRLLLEFSTRVELPPSSATDAAAQVS